MIVRSMKLRRSHRLFFALLGVLVIVPQHAWANAGTPLMWAEMLHLVFGNALIGLMEGIVLGKLFGVPRLKAIGAMIAANYLSAWLGGVLIGGKIARAAPIDLSNGWLWFWIMVGATFCLTLVLEWPFIAWNLHGTASWLKRSFRASFLVQTTSYILLFGWYWMASGTSLYTKANVVTPEELSLPGSVLVFYISPRDGDVYKRPLWGGSEQKAYELNSTHRDDRLFARPSASNPDHWDLVARLNTEDSPAPKFVEVQMDMPVEAAPDPYNTRSDPPKYDGTWFNFGEASRLGTTTNNTWQFRTGFWPVEGLVALNEQTGERVRLNYETPFIAWNIRNAVHLPGDKVLFQLGHDQICGFDPATRRIALLWRGRGPAPVIQRPIETQAQVGE